jgi:multidrug transporter EmrE-like cation transporter
METAKIIFFTLIAVAVSLEIVADILFKSWSVSNKHLILILGLTIYTIGTLFWAFSLRYEYLSKAITLFTILNLVVISLVGILYYKEDLSMINKIGIALGVLSVILIEL